MGDGEVDYTVRCVHRGGPVILTFDASESDQLWDGAGSAERPSSVILLKDSTGAGYYGGVRGLGESIVEASEALWTIIVGLDPAEILTCGSGLGGHAALIFGVLLGADRIVAFEPAAHLIADELARYNDRRWQGLMTALPDPSLARKFDVPALMASRDFSGHAFVLFGTGRGNESNEDAHQNLIHAQWLARSECVSLAPLPEIKSGVWTSLAKRGYLDAVLRRYFFEEQIPPRGSTPATTSVGPAASAAPCILQIHRDTAPGGGEAAYATASMGDNKDSQRVTDELRRWIAENLLLGTPPDVMSRRLRGIRVSARAAVAEVALAGDSPYVRGAARLQNRLKKRNWLLSVYRTLGRLRPESKGIERRMFLSRDEFFRDYYVANFPVIIEDSIDDQAMTPRWSLDDLGRRFGDRMVRIRIRPDEVNRDGSLREPETRLIRFADCLDDLRRAEPAEDFCLTSEDADNREALPELLDEIGYFPEYLDEDAGPAGSFRLAPAGASTSFRHEFKNILLAVTMGRLRVKLAPSWDLQEMRNIWRNLSAHDGRTLQAGLPHQPGRPGIIECVLECGDVLFVPVGYWYYIERPAPSADATFTNFVFKNDFPISESPEGLM
jgi:hypothetical protein